MSLKEHISNLPEERKAHAPYNFVKLSDSIAYFEDVGLDRYYPNRYSGYIDCTLTNLTDLYIRAGYTLEEYIRHRDDKFVPVEFFCVDKATKEPVIPGSSIRGMIRELCEIISFAKMKFTDRNKRMLYRDMSSSSSAKDYIGLMSGRMSKDGFTGFYTKASAGYIKEDGGEYYITPAKKINNVQYFRIENDTIKKLENNCLKEFTRHKIWFKPTKPEDHQHSKRKLYYAKVEEIMLDDGKTKKREGWERGWLIISGSMKKKHMQWIIPDEDLESTSIELSGEDIELYKNEAITDKINKNKFSVIPQDKNESIPCFYIQYEDKSGQKHYFFGHTGMFRIPYKYSIGDYIPLHGDGRPDMVESVFGYTEGKKAHKGRVLFTDARLADKQNVVSRHHVSVLGSPKPSSYQLYLNQDTHDIGKLKNYNSKPFDETVIRGYKLYWHKNYVKDVENKTGKKDVETEFDAISAGISFEFKVYFENLSNEELGMLLWVLKLPDGCKYKLGLGKPLGCGSVDIKPVLYLYNIKEKYSTLSLTSWIQKQDDGKIDELKKDFEDCMNKRIGKNIFGERRRILLRMLKFPGPKETDYMELEQFKSREILPGPTGLK
ncbi:TIGR03986 family CRISPR-associated RAMP protein [Calorimonas adulescens]|uniref:TIGR03986 family CRISPR-associated RAMP protein n=1 Tax=Calorimonas adulescens TaxID=2606906 RepID=A0A5D8QBQ7_9THEO|nr:TIGR03986 family CRISPR-associated RAMP protein [Calorimonas adulescens]TZE82165.1 TIGR03986 family CRISPR-associated RAMP protein [Calorimonas adulescens]